MWGGVRWDDPSAYPAMRCHTVYPEDHRHFHGGDRIIRANVPLPLQSADQAEEGQGAERVNLGPDEIGAMFSVGHERLPVW